MLNMVDLPATMSLTTESSIEISLVGPLLRGAGTQNVGPIQSYLKNFIWIHLQLYPVHNKQTNEETDKLIVLSSDFVGDNDKWHAAAWQNWDHPQFLCRLNTNHLWSTTRLNLPRLPTHRVTTFQKTWNSMTFPVEASKNYPSSVYRYGQQLLFHMNEKQGEAR